MPDKPPQPCATPGCPGKTPTGRCERCQGRGQRGTAQGRETTAARGYGAIWRAVRLDYLGRHPRCVLCGRMATVADHYPTSRRQLIRDQVPDPDADHRIRPLCAPHHATETAKHQPGGWHRDQR